MNPKTFNVVKNWTIYENIFEIECNVIENINISKNLVTQSNIDHF